MIWAQSEEPGSAFSKFMGADGGINPMSGAASFSKNLVTISAGAVSTSLELTYSGNVEEIVKNKNDIAPMSWVGLGWSLGHAKIISDNAGTMWLGDDTFYLLTSTGVKYKIVKDANQKWWIEGLPYWRIEPVIETKIFTLVGNTANSYSIIIGWKIVDDSGKKYEYGDMLYDEKDPKIRSATEYTIANPYSKGIVGVYQNGHDALFPSAWNLAKIEDVDGNNLVFEYEQYLEKVKLHSYSTATSYTKENYLKSIQSSQGGRIVLTTKEKDYNREYIELKGESEPDAYIDPLERRFLSKIAVYGIDGRIIKYIDFCYEPLNVRIKGSYNPDYVKRLLSSIVETDENHEEIQKELYAYHKEDFDKVKNIPLPLGTIDSIMGPNCGIVKYIYREQSLMDIDQSTGMHKDKIPLVNISMGMLEGGTNFIVGVDNSSKEIKLYFRKNGEWSFFQTLKNGTKNLLADSDKGTFFIGNKNWFVYKDGEENGTYYPYVWDGKEWKLGNLFSDNGSHDVVTVGPGYLLTAHIHDEKIELKIPWSLWGQTFSQTIKNVDDDDKDRVYVQLFASRNHFGVFYRNTDVINDGQLKLFTFGPDKSIENTLDDSSLDGDNQYRFLNDNTLVGATEGRGLKKTYYARSFQWEEDDDGNGKWHNRNIKKLDGWQGLSSIQVVGEDYFVVRHNDNDDLSLFELDAGEWKTGLDAINKVHHQDFDPKTEAEWDAAGSGNNFFVIRKPRIKEHWYGNKIKPFREFELIEQLDGDWESVFDSSSGSKKHISVGSNWFVSYEYQQGYIRKGLEWDFEDYSKTFEGNENKILKNDFDDDSEVDSKSLNGEFVIRQMPNFTEIYYKKHESFSSLVNGFLVSEKHIKDPVVDKVVVYKYDYVLSSTPAPVYDYAIKSPVIFGYTVILPDNAGVVEKKLCHLDDEIALGEICEENYYNSLESVKPLNSVKKYYERHRNDNWPSFIYTDRLTSTMSKTSNLEKIQYFNYADDVNGRVSQVILYDDNLKKNISETRNVYASEKYPNLGKESVNRLTEMVATYQCVPDCNGEIVSGNVSTYSDFDGLYKGNERLSELWTYAPKTKKLKSFSFDWKSSSHGTSWKKVKSIERFHRGVASEVSNQLGIKSSVIYEKDKFIHPLASIENAGVDQAFVVSDTCNVENVTCVDATSFTDRYLDGEGKSLKTLYGRFSKRGILVNRQNKFVGAVKKAKKTKYRFSAWVQGTSLDGVKDKLRLNLSSLDAEFELAGNGEWQYVEWITSTPLQEKNYAVTLSTVNDADIHLQDIRFAPVDALVNVTYWDAHLNLPITKVNDRGIGVYLEYDTQGRIIKAYDEMPNGSIALTKKNAYFSGVCAVSTGMNYALKELYINDEKVAISTEPGTIEIAVANNTDKLNISWKTFVDGEKVFYKLYESGKSQDFQGDLCAGCNNLIGDFVGNTMILEIAVSSVDRPYKIIVNKSSAGWVDYGSVLSEGFYPNYLSDENVDAVRYVAKEGLKKAYYDGSDWVDDAIVRKEGTFVSIGGALNNGLDYIFALPDYTGNYEDNDLMLTARHANGYQDDSRGWNNLGSFDQIGAESKDYHMVTSQNNKTYVLYSRKGFQEIENTSVDSQSEKTIDGSSSLVVRILDGFSWKDFGTVVNKKVDDAAIAVGNNNVPFVAYIGPAENVYHTEKLIVSGEDEDDDSDDVSAPDDLQTESYDVYDRFVVLKHYSATSKKWRGYASESGDVLALPEAQRVKLASDGINLYMAVTYKDENTSSYSLKVYKIIISSSKLTFSELIDNSVGSAVIVHLSANDHFDLVVRQNVPYLSFVNEVNKGYLTVVRYTGGRWISVGRPAFVSVGHKKDVADLSVKMQNGTVVPYVVLKESYKSTNIERRNKIVPMKYSSQNDKNLTISSIGDIAGTSLASDFRQYLLNYETVVPMDFESVVFDLNFSKSDDVNGVYIENNGVPVFSWKKLKYYNFFAHADKYSTYVPQFTVPLKNEYNEIKFQIYNSSSVPPLTYTFKIYRENVLGLELALTNMGVEIGKLTYASSSSSSFIFSSSSTQTSEKLVEHLVYEVYPPSNGSSSQDACLEFSSSWLISIGDELFSKPFCFRFDYPGDIVLSSSNDIRSSSSFVEASSSQSRNQIIAKDDNGNIKVIEIKFLDLSSSSSDPYDSAESSSSSNPINPAVSNSSSSPFNPGTSSSTSNADEEKLEQTITGTAIPEEYAPLYDYKFVATETLFFENTVNVSDGFYIAKNVNVSADAKVYGNVLCSENVNLSSNAYIRSLVLGGVLNIQAGARYESLERKVVNLPHIASKQVDGLNDWFNINVGQSIKMSPGVYGNVNIYANANVLLEPGAYYFKSLYIAPNATIRSTDSDRGTQIWVQGAFSIGDNSTVMQNGNAEKLFIYSNDASEMYLGVRSSVFATIVYPNGKVNIAPQSTFNGVIWAKSVMVGANSFVR